MFPVSAIPYMPHELPMVLIDEICACDENSIVTQVLLHESHLFATGQQIPAWVGIELMAQSAAAWSGFNAQKNRSAHGAGLTEKAVPIGYLLGTRDYRSNVGFFSVGSQLRIHAHCWHKPVYRCFSPKRHNFKDGLFDGFALRQS